MRVAPDVERDALTGGASRKRISLSMTQPAPTRSDLHTEQVCRLAVERLGFAASTTRLCPPRATISVVIDADAEVHVGAGQRSRVLDVPFEEEERVPFVGLLTSPVPTGDVLS
jgi:hypothetical protein